MERTRKIALVLSALLISAMGSAVYAQNHTNTTTPTSSTSTIYSFLLSVLGKKSMPPPYSVFPNPYHMRPTIYESVEEFYSKEKNYI